MDKFYKIAIIIFLLIVVLVSTFVFIDAFTEIKERQHQQRNDEMLSDDIEIERKWIVKADTSVVDISNAEIIEIEQTYISFSPEIRVRRLNKGQKYTMTIKNNLTNDGLQRDEYEFEISENQYNQIITKKEGQTIYKTRYEFVCNGYLSSLDIFHGELDGLAYFEVEFLDEKEAQNYKTPYWVIQEVTDDVLYKNGCLAQHGIPGSYYEYMGIN
jgi:CYTH domain-containing protein